MQQRVFGGSMARIPPKPEKKYPWYIRLMLRAQKRKYGKPLEPVLLWGRSPRVFLGFLWMNRALNRTSSPLDPQLRALVTTFISQRNVCAFCIDLNRSLYLQRGGTEEKLHALKDYRESPLFSKKEKVALAYAEAMLFSKEPVSQELFTIAKDFFDSDALVELSALIGFQELSSKFNAALDA